MDAPGAGDDAVAGNLLLVHAEVVALMDDEPVHLGEASLVQQQLEPLARGLLAPRVLAGDPLGTARQHGGEVAAVEFVEAVLEGHVCRVSSGIADGRSDASSIARQVRESQ